MTIGLIERIKNSVHTLFLYRHIFQELGRITRDAGLPPSVAFRRIRVVVCLRAICRDSSTGRHRRGTVSLKRLLREIADHYRVMSRQRHVALWNVDDPNFAAEANSNFDRFGGQGRTFIDPGAVRDDSRASTRRRRRSRGTRTKQSHMPRITLGRKYRPGLTSTRPSMSSASFFKSITPCSRRAPSGTCSRRSRMTGRPRSASHGSRRTSNTSARAGRRHPCDASH
jgi:hypothetical protein